MQRIIFLWLIDIMLMTACNKGPQFREHPEFGDYYRQRDIVGSFVLFDPQQNAYEVYNRSQLEVPFTPASTFKICNSLIGLETGVIPDENYVIPWDSVVRNPVWDHDHDLRTAFANSTVWYYQELARRVGGQRMKQLLDTLQYGNADTSGGIDRFWLSGGLRISPMQQVDFLQRLYLRQLPLGHRSMDITQRIMFDKDTLDAHVYGKTGWGMQDSIDVGWFIGFAEMDGKVYYFANCIQANGSALADVEFARSFDHGRKDIAYSILSELMNRK